MFRVREIPLGNLEGTAIATTGSLTSVAIDISKFIGDAMTLHLEATGTAVDLDGTFTVGIDPDKTFTTMEDASGTAIQAVCDNIGAAGTTIVAEIQFSPALTKYIKIVITGGASNDATTISKARLLVQEDIGK